jgi:hypothetical protein
MSASVMLEASRTSSKSYRQTPWTALEQKPAVGFVFILVRFTHLQASVLSVKTFLTHHLSNCRFPGSPTEIISDLMPFGIPAELLPINSNTGRLKTQNFTKWINMRLAREEHIARAANAAATSGGPISIAAAFPWIECPLEQDVLLGRGRPIMNHAGKYKP